MKALQFLQDSRGPLLDHVAAYLGLPRREIVDDTGYVPLMQSDAAYARRLAAELEKIAAVLRAVGGGE